MTDKEMAEEYLDEKCKDCYMCSCSEYKNPYKICQRRKDRKHAFLAGLKAGRPQWHDLRKDPNDLPKEVGRYIVCYLDTACERNTFELSFVDWFEDKHWIDEDNHNIEGYDEGVIAWCEIPTFDKE